MITVVAKFWLKYISGFINNRWSLYEVDIFIVHRKVKA